MNGNGTIRPRVIVFTRYPEPGRVKTRLIPALGEDGAAEGVEGLELLGRELAPLVRGCAAGFGKHGRIHPWFS